MMAGVELFNVSPEDLRLELAADLARGGYVYRVDDEEPAQRYFDKYLVLSRPGLLGRSARLLASLVTQDCERIAASGVAAATLGTALAQETGIALLLGRDEREGGISFVGELFSHVKVMLLEDVVHTGQRALAGVNALEACGSDVLEVVCLLDRQAGGAQRLADVGVNLRSLFTESQLLHGAEGPSAL
jgi:orotate phosphoribosyltransferase